MLQGFTEQGIKEIQRHGLMFQGVNLRGELISREHPMDGRPEPGACETADYCTL